MKHEFNSGFYPQCELCLQHKNLATTHCPGEKLSDEVHRRAVRGSMDFVDGEWVCTVKEPAVV